MSEITHEDLDKVIAFHEKVANELTQPGDSYLRSLTIDTLTALKDYKLKKDRRDWFADMQEFEKVVMLNKESMKPHVPSKEDIKLRSSLIEEEVVTETLATLDEILDTNNSKYISDLADDITDSIVVLLGTAVKFGIDIRPCWNLIYEANMKKKDGELRADGKRLKPEGWTHPDMKKEIERQIHENR